LPTNSSNKRAQHGPVAPIPARQNLARRHGKENREKGKVENRRRVDA
jgi:hypothetical protein